MLKKKKKPTKKGVKKQNTEEIIREIDQFIVQEIRTTMLKHADTGSDTQGATGGAPPTVSPPVNMQSANQAIGGAPLVSLPVAGALGSPTVRGGNADASSTVSEEGMCGHCMAIVNDGICCDFCETWFHFDSLCSGLEDRYRRMMDHENVLYICNECKKNRPRKNCIVDKLNLLSKKMDEIAEKIVNVSTNESEAEKNKTNKDNVQRGGKQIT